VGEHSIKFGASFYPLAGELPHPEYRQWSFHLPACGDRSSWAVSTADRFRYASFLMGQVDQAEIKAGETSGQRSWYMGYFIQDEFRATPRLT